MPRYRTKEEITPVTIEVAAVLTTYMATIPKHTRCREITSGTIAGQFWVDDLSWIDPNSIFYADACYRGIVLSEDQVETLP
jgi:hypothetical protein